MINAYPDTSIIVNTEKPYEKKYCYEVYAILLFIFCFPLGLPAIYYAHSANKAYDRKDFIAAKKKYKITKYLLIITCLTGVLLIVVIFAILFNYIKNKTKTYDDDDYGYYGYYN